MLAFIVHDWNLTYGQSAAGVGAVPGAYFWGWIADKIGRRKAFIGTALNFSIATDIMALTPDRDWIFLTIFPFFVGFGVSGPFRWIRGWSRSTSRLRNAGGSAGL